MARLVDMPKLSPTMEEGQIVAWHKQQGDPIDVDDLLADVETDKATMEFRSFDRGSLLRILAPTGTVVKLGQPVAIIGQPGENVDDLVAFATAGSLGGLVETGMSSLQAATPAVPVAPFAPVAAPASPRGAESPSTTLVSAAPPTPTTAAQPHAGAPPPALRVKASPYVRKIARERDIDLRLLSGSGPGGRIVARDLERVTAGSLRGALTGTAGALRGAVTGPAGALRGALTGPAAAANPPPAAAPVVAEALAPIVKPLTMMRRAIARRLTESKQQVPHFYLTVDVDAGKLVELRARVQADVGRKISFNDLVVKASAVAIGRAPEVNAQFTPDSLILHRRVDISVAVAIDDGLVTPVVRNADRKTVLQISDEIEQLSARARERKLSVEEMSNGTLSISNLGMYGVDEFAAVINPPEGAILAVGAIRSEPVVQGDAVVPGKRLKLTLSCDHRVVDGSVGAKFLAELRKVIEHPLQILVY